MPAKSQIGRHGFSVGNTHYAHNPRASSSRANQSYSWRCMPPPLFEYMFSRHPKNHDLRKTKPLMSQLHFQLATATQ